jgi:hypothetical protein
MKMLTLQQLHLHECTMLIFFHWHEKQVSKKCKSKWFKLDAVVIIGGT